MSYLKSCFFIMLGSDHHALTSLPGILPLLRGYFPVLKKVNCLHHKLICIKIELNQIFFIIEIIIIQKNISEFLHFRLTCLAKHDNFIYNLNKTSTTPYSGNRFLECSRI